MAEQVGALLQYKELRSAIAVADANGPETTLFKNAVAGELCLGGGAAFLKAAHSANNGTATLSLAFYDIDDNYLGFVQQEANALVLPVVATRFESGLVAAVIPGAYAYRVHVTAVANGNINVSAGYLDGAPLR